MKKFVIPAAITAVFAGIAAILTAMIRKKNRA